jgi:hypothetical protein
MTGPRTRTPDEIDAALVPVDPTSLPREDPRLDQRWSVTLDAIQEGAASRLARDLLEHGIECHIETVSPRVTQGGVPFAGMTGLYHVVVAKGNLPAAVELAVPSFPETFEGELLPHGGIWGPSKLGEEPIVLCQLPFEDCWHLSAVLTRAGFKAIVLPDDLPDAAPPAEMTLADALRDEHRNEASAALSLLTWKVHHERLLGQPERDDVAVEDLPYCVVVERPHVDEAAAIAREAYGERFHLDGNAYDG